jgi:ABC-type glycerol-3-phosphate transport system substrate-binding protein
MKRFQFFVVMVGFALLVPIAGYPGGKTQAESGTEIVRIVMERGGLWGDDPNGDAGQRVRKAIRDKIGIDVEVVGLPNPGGNDERNFVNLRLASGEQLDIFNAGDVSSFLQYRNQGLIIQLNDLLDKEGTGLKKIYEPASWATVTDSSGIIWGLPDEQQAMSHTFCIRQDWLDQLGLKIPKTMTEFETVMQAFKDTFSDPGFAPIWGGGYEDVFVGSFVKEPGIYLDSTGTLRPRWIQEGYTNFLAKMAEWYKKGYLHPEVSTMDYGITIGLMEGGRVGFMQQWNPSLGLTEYEKTWGGGGGINLSPVAPPDGGKISALAPVSEIFVISANCKNPEAAMKYLNWTNAVEEGHTLITFGQEGLDFKKNADGTVTRLNLSDWGYYCYTTCRAASVRLNDPLTDINMKGDIEFYSNPATYPRYDSPVLGFVYDDEKLQPLRDRLQQLDIARENLRDRIIMGQAPVTEWEPFVQRYLAGGGKDLYDEMTRQFKAAKKL